MCVHCILLYGSLHFLAVLLSSPLKQYSLTLQALSSSSNFLSLQDTNPLFAAQMHFSTSPCLNTLLFEGLCRWGICKLSCLKLNSLSCFKHSALFFTIVTLFWSLSYICILTDWKIGKRKKTPKPIFWHLPVFNSCGSSFIIARFAWDHLM